jgi:xylulokinase
MRLNLQILEDAGYPIRTLHAVGGGARSRRWTQLKADVTGRPVAIMEVTEAGCLGVAMLARAALDGGDVCELCGAWARPVETVKPDPARAEHYTQRYAAYRRLYAAARLLV